jgi:hypothetical protein
MTDKVYFHLNGTINKQNFKYWSDHNPYELHECPLHNPKVTVWCGVSTVGITGPYFFENEYGQAMTVTAECYKDMLETFLTPCLQMLQAHEHMVSARWYYHSNSEKFHGCALWVVSLTTDFSLW